MDSRTAQYLRDFMAHDDPFLESLEKTNRSRNDVQPNIELELGRFLTFMILAKKVKTVLELGTGTGYSTIWMAKAVKKNGGKIITIENHNKMFKESCLNIEKAGFSECVEVRHGKVEEILPAMVAEKVKFDLIFQDSGKYLYPLMLENTIKLCAKGGMIIADDTLFRVIDTVRSGLGDYTHDYNRAVFKHKLLFSTILPVGHGLTLSYKL